MQLQYFPALQEEPDIWKKKKSAEEDQVAFLSLQQRSPPLQVWTLSFSLFC